MPMTTALLAGTVAAPVVGGLFGSSSAKKAAAARAAAAQAALAELNALGVPPDLSKQIVFQQFQSQGELTPELAQKIELQASQVAQIQEDPSLRANQMEALNMLSQASRGGLRAEDRAAYNELRARVQRDSEAKRQQILQQMAARGQAGSGAELMAQLQSTQAAADESSAGADRLAAEASQRALQALAQRGSAASQLRGQDLSYEQMKAQALDDRNRFLYQNSVARQEANLNRKNQAQQANLANRQRLSELNVGQSNQELLRQNQAQRDFFQDRFNLATAKANALNNQGSAIAGGYEQKANMYSGIGNALGQGFATAGAYSMRTTADQEAINKTLGMSWDNKNLSY